jgi:hypothetical protein
MSRSLLWIVLFAAVPAPLIAQNPSGSLPGEVWMRDGALISPDARLLTTPRIAADSMVQGLCHIRDPELRLGCAEPVSA